MGVPPGEAPMPLSNDMTQLQRRRVGDWVHEMLSQAIFSGELLPGERLSVPTLADKLDVSRSPVREAVQRLVQERLAVETPHHGAVVAKVDDDDLRPLYEVREALEGMAARLATARVDGDQLRQLADIHEDHLKAVRSGDLERHIDLDQRFHRQLRDIASNPWLSGYLDQIQGQVRLAMLSSSLTAGLEQAVADHGEILDAIASRDEDHAEAVARRHIARLRDELKRRGDTSHHPKTFPGASE